MNKKTIADVVFYGRLLPDLTGEDIAKLLQLARKHHRYCERECSEENFPPEKTKKLEESIIQTFPGVRFQFQGDPRGATVKVARDILLSDKTTYTDYVGVLI